MWWLSTISSTHGLGENLETGFKHCEQTAGIISIAHATLEPTLEEETNDIIGDTWWVPGRQSYSQLGRVED